MSGFIFFCVFRACYVRSLRHRVRRFRVKVVVVTMFERGEDTGDTPGEFQLWVEREHLDQILPLPSGYHHVRMNKDGVLGMVTGVGTAKAAASVMALGLDPRFDLFEGVLDCRGNWRRAIPRMFRLGRRFGRTMSLTAISRLRSMRGRFPRTGRPDTFHCAKGKPYEQPAAIELWRGVHAEFGTGELGVAAARETALPDSDKLRRVRSRFAGLPNAMKPPFVTRGAVMASASTFWHGSKLDEWANEWTRYYTAGKGNYMVAAMEDTGTLQALTFLSQAGRVDLQRVLVLRTVSNYDREAPGAGAADSLQEMVSGNYSAYLPSLEAAQIVGDKVVRDIVEHWQQRAVAIPRVP